MSKTTAELLVEEDEYKGQFEMKTYFSGDIRVKFFFIYKIFIKKFIFLQVHLTILRHFQIIFQLKKTFFKIS